MQSIANVPINRPARYAKQLANHLSHKASSFSHSDGTWNVTFDFGEGTLVAYDSHIEMKATSSDADSLARMQDVLERHLRKFAAQEGHLTIEWVAS